MRRRVTLSALLAAAAAAGCGGGGGAAPVRAAPDVERAVRNVFAAYTAAMRDGDYGRACSHLAPESVARLREDARRLAGTPPATCGAMLAAVTSSGTAQERRQLRQVTRTVRVDGVYRVEDRDDAVTIAWAARVDGRRVPIQQPARLVNGRWKLVGG